MSVALTSPVEASIDVTQRFARHTCDPGQGCVSLHDPATGGSLHEASTNVRDNKERHARNSVIARVYQ